MFKDKDILISLTILLVTILVASSYYVISNLMKEKNENDMFKDLNKEIITDNMSNNIEDNLQDRTDENKKNSSNEIEQNLNQKSKTTNYSLIDLKSLKIKNSDLVGWIKVDGTNINYPVMQNGQYYLHYNFYKNKSVLGTPFLQENCDVKTSDNLIIYGHHISSGKMFANLVKYQNYNFYKKHKYIKFYTLENGETKENIYEICYVFKTTANEKGFKFYSYTKFYDEKEFNTFVENCRKRELYNTRIETRYGDKFITLVTCEYSQKNGSNCKENIKFYYVQRQKGGFMADIKIKTKSTIKTIDKTRVGTQRIKDNLIDVKEKADNINDKQYDSAEEYWAQSIKDKAEIMANRSVNDFNRQGKKSFINSKNTIQNEIEKYKIRKEENQKFKNNISKTNEIKDLQDKEKLFNIKIERDCQK